MRPGTRDGQRGRPPAEPSSRHVEEILAGALAGSRAYRQPRWETTRGVSVATTDLAPTGRPASEMFAGYQKQSTAARGFRCLKAPRVLATARSRKQPERRMALLMVLTSGLLVDAALASRIRQALHGPQETCPEQQGPPGQTPTRRWIFHDLVGLQVLLGAGTAPLVLHRNTPPQRVLRLLGAAYEALSSYNCSRLCGMAAILFTQ